LTTSVTKPIPSEILLNAKPENITWLADALSERAERRVILKTQFRDRRAQWMDLAIKNVKDTLLRHLSSRLTVYKQFEDLQKLFALADLPERLECFDISHTMGEATVASCVVFDHNGPVKQDYRRYNIKNITKGDDYAALRQALSRRYAKLKAGEGKLPDILIIDGGKGQLHEAEKVLEEWQLTHITRLGSGKGTGRVSG